MADGSRRRSHLMEDPFALTIGFGGSAGAEGLARRLGAAAGATVAAYQATSAE